MTAQLKIAIYTDRPEDHTFIQGRFPGIEVFITDDEEAFSPRAKEADILYVARRYARSLLLEVNRAQWLQVGGTGVDRLRPFTDFPPDLVITNTPGLAADMIADYAICAISMLAWDFPAIIRNQTEHLWQRWRVSQLAGKTLALLGLGNIGQAVAARASVMKMRVIGFKREVTKVKHVEWVAGPDQLHDVLAQADFVLLALPLTDETTGIIGPAELRTMPKSSYLINVGRGLLIREDALIKALQNKSIAGAALDVFAQEPLPKTSNLWDLSNIIITPHISSWSKDYRIRAAELFCANLDRFLAGQRLHNVIDRDRAY